MDLLIETAVDEAKAWVVTPDAECEWCRVTASVSNLIDKHAGWWRDDYTLALLTMPESAAFVADAEAQNASVCTLNSRLQIVFEAREDAVDGIF
jgi:hypothetical protein